MSRNAYSVLRWARRIIVFVIGATVTLFGVVLFFTPGPAIVVVPLGLMILATEFAWARVILTRVKEKIASMRPPPKSSDKPGATGPEATGPEATGASRGSGPGGPPDQV